MSQVRAAAGRRGWLGPVIGGAVFAAAIVLCGLQPSTLGQPAEPITHFLLAVAAILAVCHLFGAVLRRWGQPAVLGEIIGGLLLGPSVFGVLAPQARGWLFPGEVLAALNQAAQLGLIVFLFLLGCELHVGSIKRKRAVAAGTLGGMGLPFLAGVGVALFAGRQLTGPGSSVAHILFFGLAMSITALPVLARILVDLRMDRSDIGVLALTAAAVGDGVTWLALTVILAVAGTSNTAQLLPRLAIAAAFVAVLVLCVRPALAVLVRRVRSDQALMATMVIGAVAVAALAQQIDLHPMIGAFLFGALIPPTEAMTRIREQLQGFTITILLPMFFAGVGLNTRFGLIGTDPGHWLWFVVILVAASMSKIAGAGGAAWLVGMPAGQAFQLGVLMNCRGITELVVATVGLQFGLISEFGFTVLVLVAVITSAMTGILMRRIDRTEARP